MECPLCKWNVDRRCDDAAKCFAVRIVNGHAFRIVPVCDTHTQSVMGSSKVLIPDDEARAAGLIT